MSLLIVLLLGAYLIGAIPFSFLVARVFKGVDLREVGSRNVGATNACRLFSKRWRFAAFVLCFTLDALKGFLPAFFFARLLSEGPLFSLAMGERAMIVGLAAILGHVYTPYLGFRGGKGVATSLGVFLAAAPVAVLITGAVGITAILVTRFVSLGSVLMSLLLPALIFVIHPGERLLQIAAAIVGLFIIFKHRTNIRRLAQGQESKIFSKKFEISNPPDTEPPR